MCLFAVHANLTLDVCDGLHGTSAVGPFCVVHTQVHQVWSMSFTSSPISPPLSSVPRCFISQGSFTASTPR